MVVLASAFLCGPRPSAAAESPLERSAPPKAAGTEATLGDEPPSDKQADSNVVPNEGDDETQSSSESAEKNEDGPRSLVLVTIDTLRADHLGAYGYPRDTSPRIDALAEEGLLFEHAFATSSTTLPSHVSLFTSTYPARHGVAGNFLGLRRRLPEGLRALPTISEMLKGEGYTTAGFVSSAVLSPPTGIDRGFDVYKAPAFGGGKGKHRNPHRPGAETMQEALAWLATAREPFFLWVHLFEPHKPYSPPARFRSMFKTDDVLLEFLQERGISPEHADLTNRYDGEVRTADDLVGQLIDGLKERELYEHAIFALTSDHGEGLMQHGVLEHNELWNEHLHVPLILRVPGREPGRHSGLVSLIDVLPLLAQEAGLPLPEESFHGVNPLQATRSALRAERSRNSKRLKPQAALITPEWKYVYRFGAPDSVYRLVDDPWETKNLASSSPDTAARLHEELSEGLAEDEKQAPVAPRIPAAMRKMIRALGYAE